MGVWCMLNAHVNNNNNNNNFDVKEHGMRLLQANRNTRSTREKSSGVKIARENYINNNERECDWDCNWVYVRRFILSLMRTVVAVVFQCFFFF